MASHSRKFFLTLFIVCGSLLLIHLIGVYIYQGGRIVGEVGGSIKIGLVGKSPTIPNPLEYDLGNTTHDMILRFLFRSMIQYNAGLGQYEGNLAHCDIRTLHDVTCTFLEGNTWSDGTPISSNDIIATYESYKKRKDILPTYESLATNTSIQKIESLLDTIQITATGNTIRFTTKDKSASMIDILTYPIIRSDMLDRIQNGRLSLDNYISSGDYTYEGYDTDTQYGFERITLKRKTNAKTSFIDTYQFRFFRDVASMKKNEDALNIIIPNKVTDGAPNSPRFVRHIYNMYEYVSLFANTDRLSPELRTILLSNIGKTPLTDDTLATFYGPITTIFFSGGSMIPPLGTGSLPTLLAEMRYFSKEKLLRDLDLRPTTLTGPVDYGKNNFFHLPSTSRYYFASGGETEIRLTGKTVSGVTAVIINGYTLQEYEAGSTSFTYKVSEVLGTLKDGINRYTLTFVFQDGTVKEQEILTVYHFKNEDAQKKAIEELNTSLLVNKNTPELIAERKAVIDSERVKLNALEGGYFYSKKYERYSLTLTYLDSPEITSVAKEVQKRVQSMGILLILNPLDSKGIANMMKEGKEQYDFIIVGFEAPNRISNIAPVFSSTNVKMGINFSNIEDTTLDGMIQDLRTAVTEKERVAVEALITKRIQKNAIMIPLYSINRYFYYDKNIIHNTFPKVLPSLVNFQSILNDSYIKSRYHFKWSEKSFLGFFGWMKKTIIN